MGYFKTRIITELGPEMKSTLDRKISIGGRFRYKVTVGYRYRGMCSLRKLPTLSSRPSVIRARSYKNIFSLDLRYAGILAL